MKKIFSLAIILSLVFEQSGFAQVAPQLPMPLYLQGLQPADKFRPAHLRSIAFDPGQSEFSLLLDQGDNKKSDVKSVTETTRTLMEYFQVGLRLPNRCFWVNLRPDSAERIIDPDLERTALGAVFLEADVQLKKDLARFTSPDTEAGKAYWDKLYAKAESLFGKDDISVPTMTRPWIIPGEIIIKQQGTRAYVYKATMRVMLEQDYIASRVGSSEPMDALTAEVNFADPRLRAINAYSSELIRELIVPRLNREVNASRRYSRLRQAFYSLVLAQWFKAKVTSSDQAEYKEINNTIDSFDLAGLTSQKPCPTQNYFQAYKKSFDQGEYRKEETVRSQAGLVIRQYASGGIIAVSPESQISVVQSPVLPGLDGGIRYNMHDRTILVNQDVSADQRGVRDGGSSLKARNHESRVRRIRQEAKRNAKRKMLQEIRALDNGALRVFVTKQMPWQKVASLPGKDLKRAALEFVENAWRQPRPAKQQSRLSAAAKISLAAGLTLTAGGVLIIERGFFDSDQSLSDTVDQIVGSIDNNPFIASGEKIVGHAESYGSPYGQDVTGWSSDSISVPADEVPGNNDGYLHVWVKANGDGVIKVQLLPKGASPDSEVGLYQEPIEVHKGEKEIKIKLDKFGVDANEAVSVVIHDGRTIFDPMQVNNPGFGVELQGFEFKEPSIIDAIVNFFGNLFGFRVSAAKIEARGSHDLVLNSGSNYGGAELSFGSDGATIRDTRSMNWATYAIDLNAMDVSGYDSLRFKINNPGSGTVKVRVRVIDGKKDYASKRAAQEIQIRPGEGEYTVDLSTCDIQDNKAFQVMVGFGETFAGDKVNENPIELTIHSISFESSGSPAVDTPAPTTQVTARPTTAVTTQQTTATTPPTTVPQTTVTTVQTPAAHQQFTGAQAVAFSDASKDPATGIQHSFMLTPEEMSRISDRDEQDGLRGTSIYDLALMQTAYGLEGKTAEADEITDIFVKGQVPGYKTIIAANDGQTDEQPFIYDPLDEDIIKTGAPQGERGLFFSMIDPDGEYLGPDGHPWRIWEVKVGENAQVGMGMMQIYNMKYGKTLRADAPELMIAKERARAIMILQDKETGGFHMSPIGAWDKHEKPGTPVRQQKWRYYEMSTENAASAYALFAMLYEVTGDQQYKTVMDNIDRYFDIVRNEDGTFAQGMHYNENTHAWEKNPLPATDCMTFPILALGADKIDAKYGHGASFKMWEAMKSKTGVFDENGNLLGFGFSDKSTVSGEWSMYAVLTAEEMIRVYGKDHEYSRTLQKDIDTIMDYVDSNLKVTRDGITGYKYCRDDVDTGFGWWGRSVLSAASTMLRGLVGRHYNVMYLGGHREGPTEEQPAPAATTTEAPGFEAVMAAAAVTAAAVAATRREALRKRNREQNERLRLRRESAEGRKDGGTVGGIDMRMMPMLGQELAAPAVHVNAVPVPLSALDSQWQKIMVQAGQGLVPCGEIQSFLEDCATNPQAQSRRVQAENYLAWVLRLEEDAAVMTSASMKTALFEAKAL